MKKNFTLILSLIITANSFAQIGGGWDWAFNTGAMGPSIKHLKYQPNGEMLFGGVVVANAYFGSTSLSATAANNFPGNILVLGKISTAGNPTVIRSFSNPVFSFDCITTDAAGNFYVGGGYSTNTDFDFGNGVIIPGSDFNKAFIAKFAANGDALWAKTFGMGVVGAGNPVNQVLRLAVAGSGNIFFVGLNASAALNNNKYNYPVYKLDNNGNTLWFKNALNNSSSHSFGNTEYTFRDQFIDDAENVQIANVSTLRNFTFDGIEYTAPLVTLGGAIYTQHISLDGSGNTRYVNSYRGSFNNFSVERVTGNIHFYWAQYETNANTLAGIPLYGAAPYPGLFAGVVKCNSDGVLLKAKKLTDIGLTNFNAQVILPISGDRLLIYNELEKTLKYGYGVDYLYPADATYDASGIAETDSDWNIAKLISGGKANSVKCQVLAATGDTYAMVAEFGTNSTTSLPTATYGNTTLTGFNAAANLTTAYGIFSTMRSDVAFVQCKSANFPVISTTTWVGANANWNDAANWSNGIPSNNVKAIINPGSPNYPTTFTTPGAGSLQVNAGANITLPATLAIAGGIQNNGSIKINNAGFFQAFGSAEWKGVGDVEFLGSSTVLFFSSKIFTNSITLNGPLTAYYDMNIKGVNFKAGKIDMGGKKITITDPAATSLSGINPTSYFTNGTLSRAVNSTGTYEFPIGTSANFQSATVSTNNLMGVTTLGATFTNAAITGTVPATTINGVLISGALNGGRFTISPNKQPAGGNYSISLKIKGSTNTVAEVSRYAVIKRDNSATDWTAPGNYVLATTDGTTVTATMNGLTSFSDFAIGIGASVLPVKLTNFTAKINGNNTRLNWATSTETNNSGFMVQHSINGINYTNLGFVTGNGNSNQINHYAYIHLSPVYGTNYYRLQQVDYDGNLNYSSVQAVNFDLVKTALSVYPNPIVSTINFNKIFAAGATIQIINSIGQVVEQGKLSGNQYQPKKLVGGMYKVVITQQHPTIQYSIQLMIL